MDPESFLFQFACTVVLAPCTVFFRHTLSLKLILKSLRRDKLILGKEESESHCRMEPGFVRPRAAVTTSGSDNKNLNSSDTHIDHFRPDEVCLEPYLIFVIFLHEQNFWRIKFTPKKP